MINVILNMVIPAGEVLEPIFIRSVLRDVVHEINSLLGRVANLEQATAAITQLITPPQVGPAAGKIITPPPGGFGNPRGRG